MKTHVKTKEIYLAGKKYLVGSFLKDEELAMALRQGRKVLYAKSQDVYSYKDGQLISFLPSGAPFKAFRTQYDLITIGAYKLIPAWMEA
ncbi:hypothetical protein P5763_07440 [Bacillus cereus]|uniref:hypothetical protein n=1 Tax=Bacillus cereus TaxID=1396 RepID=UPI002404C331|nr:hypothetical protein [Bacillus cereus]MDF9611905.1 hypothetical protein [Bacillus cereus]